MKLHRRGKIKLVVEVKGKGDYSWRIFSITSMFSILFNRKYLWNIWYAGTLFPGFSQVKNCLVSIFSATNILCNDLFMVADILYDSWSPAMTVSSVCISILSMLSSSTVKVHFHNAELGKVEFIELYSIRSKWRVMFPFSWYIVNVLNLAVPKESFVLNLWLGWNLCILRRKVLK